MVSLVALQLAGCLGWADECLGGFADGLLLGLADIFPAGYPAHQMLAVN
jgi:hypothetical protein